MTNMDIEESPRPETKQQEDAAMLGAYREALTMIANLLELPGWPDLCVDTVRGVERLKKERDALERAAYAPR
jgi:hypothetical protein